MRMVERLSRRLAVAAAVSGGVVFLALASLAGAGPITGPQALKDPREVGPSHNPAPSAAALLPAKSSTTPSPWVSPRPVPGIVQSRQAPFPSSLYSIQNQWFDQVGSGFVVVYAGNDGQQFDQGIAVVETLDASQRRIGSLEVYRTPTRAGALQIIAAENGVLTLRSTAGAMFSFAVSARTLQPK